ncbi:hypothetical protein [Falsiroseomonas sp.]
MRSTHALRRRAPPPRLAALAGRVRGLGLPGRAACTAVVMAV